MNETTDEKKLLAWATAKPKVTLDGLLMAMQALDEGIAVDFDPAQVIGDLRTKIDAIKNVIDRLEFQKEWCIQQAAPFEKAASTIGNNLKRLKAYVVATMRATGFEELPGHSYRASLQQNPPALALKDEECSETDFKSYPNYVRDIPRRFEWDKQAIKEALVSRRKDLLNAANEAGTEIEAHKQTVFRDDAVPFAALIIGHQVRFRLNPPMEKP